tara:strand:- start:496 stop:1668 length:1173 start_codon:yes stop_codon:yes gene_type:complete
MVAGFGAGKTQALVLRTVKLIFGDGKDIAYYLPNYPLVRTIAYPRFTEVLDNLGVSYNLNRSEHTIQVNGKTIIFRTMDNPDAIVGYEVGDSMVDELDTLPTAKARHAWNKIIARNRQKKDTGMNTVAVGTTPEGFRFVYDKWAKDPTQSYELIKAPTYSNPHLPEGYIDALRETYPSNLLEAYIEGEFVNLTSGTVYSMYDRQLNHCDVEAKALEPIHVGMDFNVNNMALAVHVIRNSKAYAVDEMVGGADTPTSIRSIRERYPNNPVIVYPDASGGATSSTNASMSDIKMLKNAGFTVNAPKRNGRVRDRVATVNKALCDPQGKRTYYVNADKCPNIALGLEQQAYDKNGEPDKTGGLDHLNDGIGYFMVRQFPIKFNRVISKTQRWS